MPEKKLFASEIEKLYNAIAIVIVVVRSRRSATSP